MASRLGAALYCANKPSSVFQSRPINARLICASNEESAERLSKSFCSAGLSSVKFFEGVSLLGCLSKNTGAGTWTTGVSARAVDVKENISKMRWFLFILFSGIWVVGIFCHCKDNTVKMVEKVV